MSWNIELTYFVTPKSGPMRPMRTLRDVNRALLDDLPTRYRYQRHWYTVGRLLTTAAAEGSSRLALMLATDALLMALEVEGWMNWQPAVVHESSALTLTLDADEVQLPLALAA